MRAADTNVLVRYIANDDTKQADTVARLFRECDATREPIFITLVVLCELIWVLDRAFGLTKAELLEVLDRLFQTPFFRFEHESVVRRCLDQYRRGKANFADYIIGEISREAGCRDTVSFDQALKGVPGFTIL
jgi:predicted nucleic-acid-binding protein